MLQWEPPTGDEWSYEVKWDGIRAQVRYDRRSVCLRSRPGRRCEEFPEVEEMADALGHHRATLDGELVALRDDGQPESRATPPAARPPCKRRHLRPAPPRRLLDKGPLVLRAARAAVRGEEVSGGRALNVG
jgi:hypothetical protein